MLIIDEFPFSRHEVAVSGAKVGGLKDVQLHSISFDGPAFTPRTGIALSIGCNFHRVTSTRYEVLKMSDQHGYPLTLGTLYYWCFLIELNAMIKKESSTSESDSVHTHAAETPR